MGKLALMRNDTGKEDPELPLLQRISSLELTEPQIAAQINASQSSSSRHISSSTIQRRLCESGLHGWIAAKKPLLKDNHNKKRLVWAKKHDQWTLERWKSVLWSEESKCEIWWFFVRRKICEWMISACVVPTVKHEGGGVMVWGALLVTLFMIYLEFKAYLCSMLPHGQWPNGQWPKTHLQAV